MTISVHVYYIDSNTDQREYIQPDLGKALAGVEESRTKLWGADVMKELGLVILPSLAGANVDVSAEGLTHLEQEALTILQNITQIVARVPFDESTIQQRTQNILDAIAKAKQINGGVVIW